MWYTLLHPINFLYIGNTSNTHSIFLFSTLLVFKIILLAWCRKIALRDLFPCKGTTLYIFTGLQTVTWKINIFFWHWHLLKILLYLSFSKSFSKSTWFFKGYFWKAFSNSWILLKNILLRDNIDLVKKKQANKPTQTVKHTHFPAVVPCLGTYFWKARSLYWS